MPTPSGSPPRTRRWFAAASAAALALPLGTGFAQGLKESQDDEPGMETFESERYDLEVTWGEPWSLVSSRERRGRHLAEVTLENPGFDDLCMIFVTRYDLANGYEDAGDFLDTFEEDTNTARKYRAVFDDATNIDILYNQRGDDWVASLVTYDTGDDWVVELSEFRVTDDEDFGTGARFVGVAKDEFADTFLTLQEVIEINGGEPFQHLTIG